HLDRGEIDVRQAAHRQQPVGHQPEHEDPEHDERRHDGPLDEQLRDAHLSPPSSRAASATPFTSTAAPDTSRSWPSVTTSSPAHRALSRLGNSALRSTVPVVVSTLLSTNDSTPSVKTVSVLDGLTSTCRRLRR